ncbi:fimbrial protein [Cronobacter turicensis]|uniref:fimbrial protein n=1 Tax=Cronobacter turicensis TaxID=413502 RepID=UPI0024C2ADD1|nr:fimbrial protein [Cronobacter turicensis]MDK1184074.1 fimbrial protein [Cronobacter turicensis]MDK1204874.1 fimbrial protein [Cronobacter turicensis]MDK1213045.1 fimbrial protein [Cronobacter turicensis]MDK1218234.1 fimbrial protein [Cronobacter turicensis]MDK1232486.1 fimbrial protein [Cronobacter turicensis]
MKKIICALALSTIPVMGFAQTAGNDIPATLYISGNVTDASAGCTIEFTEPTVDIGSREISTLPAQGTHVVGGQLKPVNASLIGKCTKDGQLTPNISFTGVVDSAAGNSLVNTATGEGAATGIGVSIYSDAGYVITPNGPAVKSNSTDHMMFYVGIVKLNGSTPTAGQVQSSLTMQIETL